MISILLRSRGFPPPLHVPPLETVPTGYCKHGDGNLLHVFRPRRTLFPKSSWPSQLALDSRPNAKRRQRTRTALYLLDSARANCYSENPYSCGETGERSLLESAPRPRSASRRCGMAAVISCSGTASWRCAPVPSIAVSGAASDAACTSNDSKTDDCSVSRISTRSTMDSPRRRLHKSTRSNLRPAFPATTTTTSSSTPPTTASGATRSAAPAISAPTATAIKSSARATTMSGNRTSVRSVERRGADRPSVRTPRLRVNSLPVCRRQSTSARTSNCARRSCRDSRRPPHQPLGRPTIRVSRQNGTRICCSHS